MDNTATLKHVFFIFPGAIKKIIISSCDGQVETGDNLRVDYTAINSHCNCTILLKYKGSLILESNAIRENCSTEISILKVNQTELSTFTTIPCNGSRITFPVTHDDALYMTSRSVSTTNEPERFLQDITIFGSIQFFFKLILIYMYFLIITEKAQKTRTNLFKSDLFNMKFNCYSIHLGFPINHNLSFSIGFLKQTVAQYITPP